MVTEHRPPSQRRIRIPGTPEERARHIGQQRGLIGPLTPLTPETEPDGPPQHSPEPAP
ncbi:hypothetical protein ACWDO0_16340 [Nocardia rhamnosiphila]